MKKLIVISLFYVLGFNNAFSQTFISTPAYNINSQKGKTFIFDQNQTITNCNAVGQEKSTSTIAFKGLRFTVEHVDSLTGELTIKFLVFKLVKLKPPTANQIYTSSCINNRQQYNFKSDPVNGPSTINTPGDNIRYFSINRNQVSASVSSYADSTTTKWTVSLGTLTNPFKLRPTKGVFTSNLNLGTAIFAQYKFSDVWAGGGIIGLSLSSVTLDSASTTGHVLTTSERPAITPSASFLVSYKNINITLGVGVDYINKTTIIEKSWIFNGKPWIGFGIGISLFNGSIASSGTVAIAGQ